MMEYERWRIKMNKTKQLLVVYHIYIYVYMFSVERKMPCQNENNSRSTNNVRNKVGVTSRVVNATQQRHARGPMVLIPASW